MIGKRESNKAGADQPTTDAREDCAIGERHTIGRRGKRQRLVTVRALERGEPGGGVEDRRTRMALDKLLPTRIFEWVDGVK